ncbi:sugar phosphate isomerase/epimerase [Mobilitalea sibirica]|uniref:Sugar phosphate isomerase/epimerase n=1 Tax=Mobilitalea sibirica TaxID=1462919 RepID=A0A8J7H0K3_9FIRM|nr:sugar phosphate isomerase/epimerase [Mobilitalea sibirica]MBH1939658.1 sugar phosphate isomerase/epimerase [Mobilitalea sibirica]
MEISISTGLYYKKEYKEILDIIAKTTCKNIELFLNQAFIDVDINELKIEVSKRNLNILSIHMPLEFIAFSRKESENYWINKSIEIAKVFGAKVIVSHMVMGEYFDYTEEGLEELHKQNMIHFKNNDDVYVTTENLPYLVNGSFLGRIDELFEFVNENNINITFDTTHCAFSGYSIIKTFKKFRNVIKNIHLSDFANGIEHKVLGDGDLPLQEFISALKNENYEGFITLEFDFDNKKRNNITDNEQAIDALQKSINFVIETLNNTK